MTNDLDRQASTTYSFLAANLATGGTALPVKNINNFTNQWAIQLGKTGEEQSEIMRISGVPSGTALNTDGTVRFAHPLDTPVYQIHYDQVIFLRSTAGTAGTATALATVSITPDSYYTEYNDSSGVATYAYQTQYRNSVSGDVSGTSSWFLPGGPTFYSYQKLKSRSKDALYSANYIKSDDIVGDWINEWLEIMTNSAIKVNQGYSMGTALYSFGTAGLGTITDPLFKQANKIELTFDNGTSYRASTEIPYSEFSQFDTFSTIYPRHAWLGDTVFQVLPFGQAGSARIAYSTRTTPLSSDTDELPQSMKAYTTGCIEYVLYRAFDLDQKGDLAGSHYEKFVGYQNSFVSEITPRDQSGVKMIQFAESTSGLNDDMYLESEMYTM